jgi:hypothetical protein
MPFGQRTRRSIKPQLEPMERRALLSTFVGHPEVVSSVSAMRAARGRVVDKSFLPNTTVDPKANPKFVAQLKRALKQIRQLAASDPGSPINQLLNELKSVPIVIHQRPARDASNITSSTPPGQKAVISWGYKDTPTYADGATKNPSATLLHELTHAWEQYKGINSDETLPVRAENYILWRLNETQRISYEGGLFPPGQVEWPEAANPPAIDETPPATNDPPQSGFDDPTVISDGSLGWSEALGSIEATKAFLAGKPFSTTEFPGHSDPYDAARALLGYPGEAGTKFQQVKSMMQQAVTLADTDFPAAAELLIQGRLIANQAIQILGGPFPREL